MTDAEIRAEKEIKMLKNHDAEDELNAQHHKGNVSKEIATLAGATKQLKDKDGNNISDFFIDNGKDNHHFSNHPTAKDLHENILDTISAIHSDTEALLNE